jgi:xylan 1,4-beta-xylosidase
MLTALGALELPVRSTGDGAGGLVNAWASRSDDGAVTVLLWNLTLDQSKAGGDPLLTRQVRLTLTGRAGQEPAGQGATDGVWTMRQRTLAVGRGDLAAAAATLGVGDWPADDAHWGALASAAQTPVVDSLLRLEAGESLTLELELDMPSAVLIELRPGRR